MRHITRYTCLLLFAYAIEAVTLTEQATDSTHELRSFTTKNNADHHLRGPRLGWPRPSVRNGVTVSRTFGTFPQVSYFYDSVDNGCKTKDNYGSNKCNFDWGDIVQGTLVVDQGVDLTEEHVVEGRFTIDSLIHWNFSCAVCGKPCTMHIPVIDKQYTFDALSCPFRVTPEGVDGTSINQRVTIPIDYKLPDSSPVNGKTIHVIGKIKLSSTKEPSKILASMDVDLTMQ